VIWHGCSCGGDHGLVGAPASLAVDPVRRLALSRYHTVLHVLNTIALREHGAMMTGTQIAVDYARIDFRIEGFTPALRTELEGRVNAVLGAAHPIRAYSMPEGEFAARDDLRRTLDAAPPVVDGSVRVVEIVGFDAQACGGTHVPNTLDLGRFAIERSENKGRINKRLYVRLS
jgi:misacylated tRNA(Ala) deacylase